MFLVGCPQKDISGVCSIQRYENNSGARSARVSRSAKRGSAERETRIATLGHGLPIPYI